MIIDAHQHTFWYNRDDSGLITDMDECKIDMAWLLTCEIPPEEDVREKHDVFNPVLVRADGTHPGMPLSDAVSAYKRYPERFILGYCPTPMHGNAAELFEAAYHMYGARICGEWKYRMLIDDPRCLELFHKAGELNCPVVFHLEVPYLFNTDAGKPVYYPRWYGGTVENLEQVLKACPDTIFLGHAPGFWREISGDASVNPDAYPREPLVPGGQLSVLFDKYANLYADLSGGSCLCALQRNPKYAREFICRYADRALFGRDYYGSDLYDFLQTLELPEEVQNKIYFQNALRLVA